MSKLCPVCKKRIIKGDIVAIMSYPIESVGDHGEYRFDDFLRNETKLHFDCLNINNKQEISYSNDEIAKRYNYLKATLDSMKEQFDKERLMLFVEDHMKIQKYTELLREWFNKRDIIIN